MPDTGAASRVPRDVEIARIAPGEVPAAAHVAARALHDDPFFVHLAPDERLRRRGMPIFWSASLRATVGAGETYVARRSGVVAAVASWLPPGGYPLPLTGQARQAFGALRSLAL
ncbi:MAG: hypothetical protein ACXVWF_10560, partial [Actinomycetota bacterium]